MILIPAYEPDETLVSIIDDLLMSNIVNHIPILIVNDGSNRECSLSVFQKISTMYPEINILSHEKNRGKGAAIKTGIEFAIEKKQDFIITVDADGQHIIKDVEKIFLHSMNFKNELVIGTRAFSGNIPLRSKFGNIITRFLFNLLHSSSVEDTQSGLRYIPNIIFQELLTFRSDRYEFEQEMLSHCAKRNIIAKPCYIETIYEDGNPSSHFNKFFDSAKIYYVMFRAALCGLLISVLDFCMFNVIYNISGEYDSSVYLTRAFMFILYYVLLKKIVFKSNENSIVGFVKLLALTTINGMIVVAFSNTFLNVNEYAAYAYVFSNLVLFVVNFSIQKFAIFHREGS